jgi:hypothetical protein
MILFDLSDLRRAGRREEPQLAVEFRRLRRHRATAKCAVRFGCSEHGELDLFNHLAELAYILIMVCLISHESISPLSQDTFD